MSAMETEPSPTHSELKGEKRLKQARLSFPVFKKSPETKKCSEPANKKLCFGEDKVAVAVLSSKKIDSEEPICVNLANSPQKEEGLRNGVTVVDLADNPDSGTSSIKKKKRETDVDELVAGKPLKKMKLDVKSKLAKFAKISETSQCSKSEDSEAKIELISLEADESSVSKPSVDNSVTAEKDCDPASDKEVVLVDVADSEGSEDDKACDETLNDIQELEEDTVVEKGDEEGDGTSNKTVETDDTTVVEIKTPKSKRLSDSKKKTPKQLEKEAEIARRKEEKERLKIEKEKKRLQEKEEKQKLKEEKELQRKKEIEEKEEAKRKLKEEKEKKRQQEIDQKNEEKRRKEEEKRQKEEELKLKKEEEIAKKKEEETAMKNKFAKEAEAFTSFFKKVETSKTRPAVEEEEQDISFKPFALKSGMRLAPTIRNLLTEERKEKLDGQLREQNIYETYITQLRCGDIKPGHSGNTWPLDEKYEEDVVVVEELGDLVESTTVSAPKPKLPRPKLLQFKENRRPPYWGTWRKKCPEIRPRRPFGQYKSFEYDVDSDDEWEEEEPGESLHGSDDEKDVEEEDDYEVDNQFFVPHGYLSEDEDQEEEVWSPERQKEKLKLLGEQFDQERSEKTRQLRPVVLGCMWTSQPDPQVNSKVLALLAARAAVPWITDLPIPTLANSEDSELAEPLEGESPPKTALKKIKFPDEKIPALLRLVHGSNIRRKSLALEFLAYWSQEDPNSKTPSLAAVCRKVKEVAQWQECPDEPLQGRLCWFVSKETREKYGEQDLPLPNTWEFITSVERRRTSDGTQQDTTPRISKFTKKLTLEERKQLLVADNRPEPVVVVEEKKPVVNKITKFTKILSEEERRQQLKVPLTPVAPAQVETPPLPQSPTLVKAIEKLNQFRASPVVKKRVMLKSVPLGTPRSPVASVVPNGVSHSSTKQLNGSGSPVKLTPLPRSPIKPAGANSTAAPVFKKRVALLASVPLGTPINSGLKSSPKMSSEPVQKSKENSPVVATSPLADIKAQKTTIDTPNPSVDATTTRTIPETTELTEIRTTLPSEITSTPSDTCPTSESQHATDDDPMTEKRTEAPNTDSAVVIVEPPKALKPAEGELLEAKLSPEGNENSCGDSSTESRVVAASILADNVVSTISEKVSDVDTSGKLESDARVEMEVTVAPSKEVPERTIVSTAPPAETSGKLEPNDRTEMEVTVAPSKEIAERTIDVAVEVTEDMSLNQTTEIAEEAMEIS